MVRALIIPALRPLRSLKTSSTVLGLYGAPPSIFRTIETNKLFCSETKTEINTDNLSIIEETGEGGDSKGNLSCFEGVFIFTKNPKMNFLFSFSQYWGAEAGERGQGQENTTSPSY